jgi:TolB-like protein
MSLFTELRRRNVIRVGAAYLVSAWLVVQVVATIAPAFDLGGWVLRVVVIALTIGFIPALILSWIFELTPEGLRRDADVEPDRAYTKRISGRLDRIIIIVLTVAVGYFAIDKFLVDPARDEALMEQARLDALHMSLAEASVAVLPFRSLGAGPGDDFLSAGIAEEVLSSLALVPRLRVISGHSSFAIQSENATVPELAERLNATLLVGGSIRKVGETLRISARLIDARSDSQLWAQDFDRRHEDVLALQSEISEAIVVALQTELGLDIGEAPELAFATSPQAHEAYLRGRLLVRQRTPNAVERAVEEFDTATRLDPEYALAHAELAIAIKLDEFFQDEDEAARERLRFHAERAYELDPDLAEANAAMAWLSDDGNDMLTYLRRAVEINPNYSDAWYWMFSLGGVRLGLRERFDALETAVRIDPLSQPANWDYIYALISRNRPDDARAQIDKYESLDARGAIFLRGVLASLGGHTSEWTFGYLKAASSGSDDLIFGRLVSWQWVWHLEHLGLIDEMLARRDSVGPDIDAYFGDTARGIEQARNAVAERPDDWFRALHFGQILAHVGRLQEARPFLERGWQQLGETYLRSRNDLNSAILADSLIAARRAAGDTEGADRILAIWREGIKAHRAAGITATYEGWYGIDYHDGVVSWLTGDRQKALRLLRQAVEDGFTIPPRSAYQEARYSDPAFARLLDRQNEIHTRERHKVLAIVCSDNPYAEVWQPLDKTCETYRAELADGSR